jgi:hypothetical protein
MVSFCDLPVEKIQASVPPPRRHFDVAYFVWVYIGALVLFELLKSGSQI